MAETFPENFPGKKQLEAAGVSPEQARGMTEEELTQIDGIGPKTAAEIVAFTPDAETQTPQPKGAESQATVKSVKDKTGHTNVVR